MDREPVISSHISEIGYDADTGTVEVAYKNGAVYRFANVPIETYRQLRMAPSIGAFFHNRVKGRFQHQVMKLPRGNEPS